MEQKENKMGVMPVNKLLINMSLPMMISMLVQALYNIVDSVFVARISEDALTAVSLAFPVQSLLIALGAGTGVGINAMLSKSLGEKKFERANKCAGNGVFLAFISYLVFLVVGLFFVEPFYEMQTKALPDLEQAQRIATYGKEYLTICCVMSIGVFFQMTFERLLQATGKTFYTMITQGVGAIINIIIDPILIFGLCGMPKLGVMGAAVATVAGQIVAAILAIVFNQRKNQEIKLTRREFIPEKAMIAKIYSVGVPSIIMQAIGSVMVYGMNKILMNFSATATAVFGVYFKLQSFIFMPVFGLNNGMVPIIAYNYGAKNRKRLESTIKYSVIYAVTIMLLGLATFQIIPDKLLMLFDASKDMLAMGTIALRLISLSFLFAGFCIVASSVFQALGNGIYSLTISVMRQLVVILPVAYLLSRTGNVNFVWLAFPIAEIVSVILSAFFLKRIHGNVISKLGNE